MKEYLSLTQLGELFGVSRVVMGRWLHEIGLRENNEPTAQAIKEGFCVEGERPADWVPFWIWHADKTIALLEQHGHTRRPLDGDSATAAESESAARE